MKPYHVQTLVNNLSKFGIRESTVLKMLEKRYDGWSSPDPEEDAADHLANLKSGFTDVDYEVEWLVIKKGWARVVFDDHMSIGAKDLKTLHAIAKVVDKKYPKYPKGMYECELTVKTEDGRSEKDYRIEDPWQWEEWIKKGGDPKKIGKGRSDIGRTMAQFR
tara:strand:- start:788 stop:1273 length:486 start_codon:yes stop_codon:yes gene_type:complete